ncbi:ATP-binding cassette domain-containing protein [Mucilaginibacter humi]|uniref:ATP-binding cassette domain-containing protein n=1 Tax=Mucilaginibacter humi TaxID=2732510 RepID=UPI00293BFB20|nr:ATP-binding cassette domain-containing protein [Mucilaginibacter humi]
MEPREPVIVVEHLYKSFGANKVLQDFNLTVHANENVVVLGKSGSGKSVLIKCIIGLLRPESGRILVFGKDIPGLGEEELDEIRVRIGFLSGERAL